MEAKNEFLINFNKDENRKLETDFQRHQHEQKMNRLRRAEFELRNLMFMTCNPTHKFLENKKLRRIRRMIDELRNLKGAKHLKFHANDFSSTEKMRACVCGKYNSNSSRFKSMLIALKPPTQESEEEYKCMESLINQYKNYLFDGKMNHNIFYPPMHTTAASSPCSSTVTRNNCGMEPLLKKLNDISIQDMDKA